MIKENNVSIQYYRVRKPVIARRFLPKQSPGVTAEIASSQKTLLAMTGSDTFPKKLRGYKTTIPVMIIQRDA
jgi:hypothetical protein